MSERRAEQTIPIIEEEVQLHRRTVDAATVRLDVRIAQELARVEELLLREEVEITRTPVRRDVDAPEQPRWEGEVLVVPVMEEVLVVRKQLRVTEEVRVARRQSHAPVEQTVPLAKQSLHVAREPANPKAASEKEKDYG